MCQTCIGKARLRNQEGQRALFGKGIGQMIIPFPNGTMLGVTTLRYFTPNGTWLGDGSSQHHGITPDHVVKQETKVLRPGSETDNQLKFALELLK